jgi:uncharacterized protein with beta-barrel porin domain
MKTFNNTAGTTSSEFAIGVGGAETRNIVLTAVCDGSSSYALDKQSNSVEVAGIEFYDMRVIAKNANSELVAKQIRGTINNTTVTQIEDVFQEEFTGGVVLTSDGSKLYINCVDTGSLTNYTIHVTLTRIIA